MPEDRTKTARTILAAAVAAAAVLVCGAASAQQNEELHAKLPERIKSAGVIKVGAPRTIQPQVFLKDGQLTGLAVDLADAMGPILGVKFEWQDMQWPGIIPGLQSGSIDASLGIMSYLPERTKFLDMIPYMNDLVGVIAAPDVKGIGEDPMSLCGRKIGGIQGTNYVTYTDEASKECVKAGKPAIDHKVYANSGSVLTAFRAGNVEAFITSYAEATTIAKTSNRKDQVHPLTSWQSPPTVIATSNKEKGLAEALQGAMATLEKNGEYQKILDKYDLGANALPADKVVINPQ